MKIFGMLSLVVLCIALGLTVDYFKEGDTSLVSEYGGVVGGAYGE